MPVRIIICKARRAGLSTGVEAFIFDDITRHAESDALIVGNQINPSENVLAMCTRFWEHLPKAIRFETSEGPVIVPVRPDLHPRYNNNPPKDLLEFAAPLKSRLFTASAKSIDAYLGYGFQNLHATEAAYYDNGWDLFRALQPALSDDVHSAQYIESTPNGQTGKGAWFYEQVIDAKLRGKTEFGETRLLFIPWHEMTHSFSKPFEDMSERAAFERSLKKNERDIMLQFPNVTLEQMKWRRAKIAQPPFNKDEDIFDQEFPSDIATAFLLSGTSVFTRGAIKKLMAGVREPIWQGDIYWGDSDRSNEREPIHDLVRRPHFYTPAQARAENFASHVTEKSYDSLKVWRWPSRNERIVIAADIGRGNPLTDDGDYSTICVLVLNELAKDELIMTWRGKLNPILFGEVCAALAWGVRYRVGDSVKKPLLAPEWTGPGSATCTYIDEKRLYEVDKYRMPGVTGMPKTKHIGWESNSKTKPYSVNWMVRMIENGSVEIPSEELVLEMSSYRQKDNFGDEGSYGGAGGHDDLVSSFQIGCAILRLETTTVPGGDSVSMIDMDSPIFGHDSTLEPFDELLPQEPAEETYGLEMQDDEFAQGESGLFWGDGW